MDEAKEYEIQLLCDNLKWAEHQEMERCRLMMYTFSAPYMKHKKNLTAFFPLETDKRDELKEKPLEGKELEEVRNRIREAFKIKDNERNLEKT